MTKRFAAFPALLILAAVYVMAQGSPDPGAPRQPGQTGGDRLFGPREPSRQDDNTRSLEGLVLNADDKEVKGAVVQLKDTKTLRIRSYITLEDGKYSFHGLSTEVDYEVKATFEDQSSRTRRLSVYDSRKQAYMDLKLQPNSETSSESDDKQDN